MPETSPSTPPTQDQLVPAPVSTGDGAPDTGGGKDRRPEPPARSPAELPKQFGPYRVTALLGTGGFGVVYRGRDDDLQRDVAIKVPHRHRIATPADLDAYVAEARVLAQLDHPAIVPVYHVGRTDDGLCYLVSKLIDGGDLRTLLREGRPFLARAVEIVARAGEALHHAHQRGLVHRDIKPANLLLDRQGQPVVADFGLALREQNYGRGSSFAGTPAYMSPEQARGEGHRVDARTDVYSLGVVFYELLTGHRPFDAPSVPELFELLINAEPRPPRQRDDTIPKEVDRICLKCLAKRASDRYSTARDLADDLRHWQASDASQVLPAATRGPVPTSSPVVARSQTGPQLPTPTPLAPEEPRPAKVVPKGLRAFDAADADFFLDLLPGPRDRDGLPEGLRFWKTRIEETDPDKTFSVGLLYGPSGCGKSSLVKAGLLPRLADHVRAVYVEATAADTESRLLRGLRKHCPEIAADRSLAEALADLRRNPVSPRNRVSGEADRNPVSPRNRVSGEGTKVLLVLDQFEQWLHAQRPDAGTPLVQALRQCDGRQVQALLLVRDDFGMAATRFLDALEVPLSQGHNFATVDLFDPRHARTVLEKFGRAFGCLSGPEGQLPPAAEQFLDQSVQGLAEDGRVISVRLALFAEMVKGKPWTPATLKAVGGMAGIGVTFLEETFASAHANPRHRLHQRAAQAVLKALLPEPGTGIKGHRQSEEVLRTASGYGGGSKDFEELLRVLDAELRLITPAEAEDEEGRAGGVLPTSPLPTDVSPAPPRFHQLTHDYLVPSLRDWLTRKQKETRRGRAELRLTERTALWTAKPENRHLPSWWEWATIRLLTRRQDWTVPQRQLMRRAGRLHALQGGALMLLLAGFLTLGLFVQHGFRAQRRQDQATALVRQLLETKTERTADVIGELAAYRDLADPLLREAFDQGASDSPQKLHAALALLPVDETQRAYLLTQLLKAEPDAFPVIRDALSPYQAAIGPALWEVLDRPAPTPDAPLRAASALATYAPEDARWPRHAAATADRLVALNAMVAGPWVAALRPVGGALLEPLSRSFRDRTAEAERRTLATDILADYAADRPERLTDLILDADEKQFDVLFKKLRGHAAAAVAPLHSELDQKPQPAPWPDAPLDTAWKKPDDATRQRLEAAHGLLEDRFALCQTLPLADFTALAEALRPCGYRPIRVRPYAADGAVLVAAVWHRDGREWQLVQGQTAAEIHQRDAALQKLGFRPVDVAGYKPDALAKDDLSRFVAVWVKEPPVEDVRLYVGIAEKSHEAAWKPLFKAKLQPATLHAFLGPDGQARYSAVFRKTGPNALSAWREDQGTYGDRGLGAGLPMDLSVLLSPEYVHGELGGWLTGSPWLGLAWRHSNAVTPSPERLYAGVYLADARFDYLQVSGVTPDEQLQRGRDLARQGYRPVALSAASPTVTASIWHRPVIPEAAKERLAKRQANAGVALLRLGQEVRVWPQLRHQPDPRARSYLIERLSPLQADPHRLIERLDQEPDVSVRRALLLSLGDFTETQLPAAERQSLVPRLLTLYRDDADRGIHGAAEWLLRRWQQEAKLLDLDSALKTGKVEGTRQWYLNKEGQTFVVIPESAEPFLMGSPRGEAGREDGPKGIVERQHRRSIGRTFALATKEVTVAEFRRFTQDRGSNIPYNDTYSPTDAHPINQVTWYAAAEYCNWLSEKSGLPEEEWCYKPHPQRGYAAGMTMKPDYLKRQGYRLPTEAEWEYACRAGAATSRYCGETDDVLLLGRYAWYSKNSQDRAMLPVGRTRPNDWGLFDLLGNAAEWCQDRAVIYPDPYGGNSIRDIEEYKIIEDSGSRLLRGGAFTNQAVNVRSADRLRNGPANRNNSVGLRPARTYR